MHGRAAIMGIVLFVLIVAGMFIFAYMKKTEITDVQTPDQSETVSDDRYANIERITGKHYFIDGVHTVVGEIPMPTPCDLLEAQTFVAESYPEQITIDFSVINNADTCTQVVTPARFKVTATASEDATWSARFMGRAVELNLIPAEDGETPDDYEVFIKG